MARPAGQAPVSPRRAATAKARLIAVDGVDAAGLLAEARAALGSPVRGSSSRGGVSRWDASGVFQELAVADEAAGRPSARTLLLLYAADLAFRLRWQVRPALAEGRTVVVAPYVDTAVAFGKAAGLETAWLTNLFRFAPRPNERRVVYPPRTRAAAAKDGFVAFACEHMIGTSSTASRRQLAARATALLRAASQKGRVKKRKPRA
jgi:hypothetical protein